MLRTTVKKGLYLVCWPGKSYSVFYYKKNTTIEELFWDVDAFGDPFSVRIVRMDGDVGIDFNPHGKGLSKHFTDRPPVEWIRFPKNIREKSLARFQPGGRHAC